MQLDRIKILHFIEAATRCQEETWQQVSELNFFAAVRLARLCASEMEKRGGSAFININSIYGREAGGPLTYNSSKAAMVAPANLLAHALACFSVVLSAFFSVILIFFCHPERSEGGALAPS
jgi:NAD(P)-dependent dehydrogenase (short-subunit alcohol dehydrogenase family)